MLCDAPSIDDTATTAISVASPPASSTAYPARRARLSAALYSARNSGVEHDLTIVPAPPWITRRNLAGGLFCGRLDSEALLSARRGAFSEEDTAGGGQDTGSPSIAPRPRSYMFLLTTLGISLRRRTS